MWMEWLSVLEGLQGTVFYIAGYLLRTLMEVRTNNEQLGIQKFVEYNSFDHRSQLKQEIHKGAMERFCPLFFHFVCLMEALYKVDLTPPVAATF
jgi:hypothetical protein